MDLHDLLKPQLPQEPIETGADRSRELMEAPGTARGSRRPSLEAGKELSKTDMLNNLNSPGASITLPATVGSQGAAQPYPFGLERRWSCSPTTHQGKASARARTVCLEPGGFAVSAARLVYGLDEEDVAGAALEPVDGVVVLLDVGDDHPAVHGVVETCSTGEGGRFIHRKGQNTKTTCC